MLPSSHMRGHHMFLHGPNTVNMGVPIRIHGQVQMSVHVDAIGCRDVDRDRCPRVHLTLLTSITPTGTRFQTLTRRAASSPPASSRALAASSYGFFSDLQWPHHGASANGANG